MERRVWDLRNCPVRHSPRPPVLNFTEPVCTVAIVRGYTVVLIHACAVAIEHACTLTIAH